ncbi:cell division protein ZipA (plasmid) [Legionella adelaidensis]|uniref:Cell division protein ZipA n=1 Tax=Legionella adelaidensis TaxID=45056 RepID=A0A0W0R5T5_9GAMM|nr:cell division protein ZipA C-terminal FtsZ-binding domain-containing protein [Legionella adelaidensis]KTC66435.1 cell division protein ZipA [Legionella adelaidensis]VEH86277.1 cell division protein ZipA [Legionella adelaidensis]
MQANWSLILNILLLIGVIVAINRMMKARRQTNNILNSQPSLGHVEANYDDIIAVRKIDREDDAPILQPAKKPSIQAFSHQPPVQQAASSAPVLNTTVSVSAEEKKPNLMNKERVVTNERAPSVMIFLLAKENRQLAGYELLQTVLAAGLRFGEGHIFHRHQYPNGQGPVLCSLAAATPTGVFDLQNIGAFSVHGLCLFMHASGNSIIDKERFTIMLDTAKQLSEGLDTYLLDSKRQPWNDESIQEYYSLLNIQPSE